MTQSYLSKMQTNERICSVPFSIPSTDKRIIDEDDEDIAANKIFYERATFAMYNRIVKARTIRRERKDYLWVTNYFSPSDVHSFMHFDCPSNLNLESNPNLLHQQNIPVGEQEDDCGDESLQFIIEI